MYFPRIIFMLENPINSEKRLLSMRIIHENWNYPTHCSLIWCVLLKNESYYLHFLFIDKILEMNFICVSECRKYLDLEYFFLSEKNTNVVIRVFISFEVTEVQCFFLNHLSHMFYFGYIFIWINLDVLLWI